MIRKTVVGFLVLATLGTVALWAFAFFGGPYTTDWDLTDRSWCMLWLAPGRCEVSVTRLSPHTELIDLPNSRLNEQLMELNRLRIATLREANKELQRALYNAGLSPWQRSLPTTLGFGWDHRVKAATLGPRDSKWYGVCPSWALLLLGGLLGTYPAVVFIRRPFRRARRRRNGWCLACGYDLQGNVSGVCPECGKDATAKLRTP